MSGTRFRKPIALLLALLMLASVANPIALAQERESEVGIVVSTTAINIRDCPRPDCAVIDSVPLGGTLDVLAPPEDGFINVRHSGKEGWAYALFIASSYTGTPTLTEGAPGCKRVALIFNIGTGDFDDPVAWSIFDTLVNEGVKATMFIRGWWAEYYPAYVRDFADAGFVIGTHGNTDLELDGHTTEAVMLEIQQATGQIDTALGQASDSIFSPASPSGDPRVHSMIAFAGYLPVLWQVEAGDAGDNVSADDVRDNVLDDVYDGAIVEMHLDTPASATATAPALPGIIASLRADGYQFVTIPEMAQPCA